MQDTGIESTIKYRLLEIERAVRRALDKVKGARPISPYGEEIKNTIEDELNKFCDNLKQLSASDEIIQLKQEAEVRLMDRIRISSDLLLGRIEDILSQEASTELYYFLDFYLDLLVDEKILVDRPKILIIKGYELRTYPFDRGENLWVIEVPTKTEGNVFEWPTLLHELAHIVEHKLKIIDTKFKRSYAPIELETGSVEATEYFHCKEYLCDYIALLLCGPIWLFILYDLYLLPTYLLPKTHPEWINRVMIVKERILSYLSDLKQKISTKKFKSLSNEETEKLLKFINNVEQLKYKDLPPLFRKPLLLDDIFTEVEKKLDNVRFKIDIDDMVQCVNSLVKFEPYVSRRVYIVNEKGKNLDSGDIDINVLINSGYLIYRLNIFDQGVKKYFEFDDYKMKSEFIYLVSECVRSARIAMIAKEALLS